MASAKQHPLIAEYRKIERQAMRQPDLVKWAVLEERRRELAQQLKDLLR